MEWSVEDTFKIINLYRQFPCLWDLRSALYKRADMKRNAWQEIARNMHREEDDVRKKMKNLRSAYVTEKRKMEISKKSGSSPEDIYVPHLFYFEELNFLETAVMFRKTTSNLTNKGESETRILSFGTENCSFVDENFNLDDIESQESVLSNNSVDSPGTPKIGNKYSKKRRVEREEKFSSAIDAFVRQADISSAMMISSKKDEENMYIPFCKSISLQLAQLSITSAAEAMAEIQTMITKRLLNEKKTDILQTAINEANIE